MKRFLKLICALSFLILISFVGTACGEPTLENLELSIADAYATNVGTNRYIVEKEEGTNSIIIPIQATLTPSSFSTDDLSWSSTYTDVAIVNDKGVATCRWSGTEDRTTTITATYSKGGTKKSASILLTVTSKPLPKFESTSTTITYTGTDLKSNFKVTNEENYSEGFKYQYINIDTTTEVQEIVNCGKYRVYYLKEMDNGNSLEYARIDVKVEPYELTFTAKSGASVYGDAIQESFYNSYTNDTIENNGIDITGGIGKDISASLGKMIYTTTATNVSNAGTYETNIAYKLTNNNYKIAVKTSQYTIQKRAVALKVDDQTITYGGSVTERKFSLYDTSSYIANNNSFSGLSPITHEKIDYKKEIETYSYVLKQNGDKKSVNKAGYFDAGTYQIGYESIGVSSNFSEITIVEFGTLTINRKEATIVPYSLSKEYGEYDNFTIGYTTNDIYVNEDIVDFLYIDYTSSKNVTKDFDLGISNCKAPAGEYNYKIDNTKNNNYNLILDEKAGSVFTVKKCEVVVNFGNQEFFYKSPNVGTLHSVSYYGSETADYEIKIASVVVAGTSVDEYESTTFGNQGTIVVPSGDEFSFQILLSEDQEDKDYYLSYNATLDSTKVVFSTGNSDNYNITVQPFKVNLKNVVLTVTPSATETESCKTFNATSGEDDSVEKFLSKFTLSSDEDISNLDELKDLANILQGAKTILSLRDAEGKYNVLLDNSSSKTSEIRNAGKYEVFLATNLQYKNGMEYVNFVLDNSKKYYFTIKPKDITIIPQSNQKKTYCEAEPTLLYSEDESTSLVEIDETLVVSGSLSRAKGEECATYLIDSLGTLSYGSNYTLTLSSNPVYFTIKQRNVTVKPFSYTVTYGADQEIAYNYYVDGGYDESLYKKPTFTGGFSLRYNNSVVSKVGGSYPVQKESNTAVAYNIALGDFKLTNNNYSLIFDESSTYLVEPRDVYVDIVPSTYSASTSIPDAGENLNIKVSDYTPMANSSHQIYMSAIEYAQDESTYYVESVDKLTISIKSGDIDLTYCYNVILGQNIVYRIETQTIEFKIVSKTNTSEQEITKTYNGTSMQSLFTLTIVTSGYSFANDLNNQPSKYNLIFSNSKENTTTPTDVGSYSVDVQLNEGDQLVVKKDGTTEPIVFTSFNKIVSNCLPVISQQKGFLNIEKADVSYDASLLAFEKGIYYKDTKDSLSNILTTSNNKNVFCGVNNSSITLKNFDGKNYEFVSSPSPIEMLTVGTHNITLSVTVEKNGVVDSNYKTLTIDVPLSVSRKEIEIDKSSVEISSPQGQNLVYNGNPKTFNITLNASSSDYQTEYAYVKLQTVYDNDVEGKLQKFRYKNETVSAVMDGDNFVYLSVADLANISQEEVKTINYNSQEYIVIGENCFLKSTDSSSTQNAGIYICLVQVSAKDNYILKYTNTTETFTQVQYLKFFEIKKSSEVEIINWKENFAYETAFNINLQDSLPFEYALSPDFKDDVVFLTDNEEEWAKTNYILAVGQYEIEMKIDTENCFFTTKKAFSVVPREAQVTFNTITNTYEYSEDEEKKPEPKTSFLDTVEAKYTTKGNVEHIVAYKDHKDEGLFTFTYYNGVDDVLAEAPSAIGDYYVICEYNANNYAGKARYDYRITQMRYQGAINATDKVVEYKPTYTSSELYNIILSMLIYDKDEVKEVEIKDVLLDQILDFSGADDSWIKDFVSCEKPRKLKFIVKFKTETYANRDDITAELTFKQISISNSVLTEKDANVSSYTYIGQPIYKELYFKGVSLAPKDTTQIVTESIDSSQLSIAYGQVVGTEVDSSYVTIKDYLGNLVFILKYNYYKTNESGTYEALSGYPISPGNYKVEYKVVQVGGNYNYSFTTYEKNFSINKTEELSVYVDGVESKTYSGADYLDTIYNELAIGSTNVAKLITVKNSDNENVKFTLIKNDSSLTTSLYNEKNGICLLYTILDDSGNQVQEVVNAGVYKAKVSLMFFTTFDPANYFTTVSFNGSKSTAESIKSSIVGGEYSINTTNKFEIEQADFPYSLEGDDKINEFAQAFSITKYRISTENDTKIIEIANDGTFVAPEGYSLSFKFSGSDYTLFKDVPTGDYIYLTISSTSNNYLEKLFRVKKYSGDLPTE